MKRPFLSSLWLPLLSGVLLLLATPYGGSWPVAAFALVPFFVHFATLRTKRQIVLSSILMAALYCYGEGEALYHLAGTWWVGSSPFSTMLISVTYALGISAIIIAAAFSYVIPMLLVRRLTRTSVPQPFVVALIIMLIEFVRSVVFYAGYSWGVMGYLLIDVTAVKHMASVVGVYGLTFIFIFWNVWVANLITRFLAIGGPLVLRLREVLFSKLHVIETVTVTTVVVGVLLFGLYRESVLSQARLHMRVAVISSVVSTNESINEASYVMYRALLLKALGSNPNLILTPENVFPYFIIDEEDNILAAHQLVYLQNAGPLWEDFLSLTQEYPKTIFALAAHTTVGEKNYNSIVLYQRGQILSIYHKRKPIPFTEFAPLGLHMKIFETISSGADVQDFRMGDLALGGYLCSEVGINPLSAHGAKLILSPSNDTVLVGSTILLLQHQFARMHALESGAFLLRSTKGGISSIIDPAGNVIQSLSGQNDVMIADI